MQTSQAVNQLPADNSGLLASGFKGDLSDFLVRPTDNPLSEAFNRKFTVHAGFGSPGAGKRPSMSYEEVLGARPERGLALYFHLPFCHNQCLYCGFFGRRPETGICQSYARALEAEIEWLKNFEAARGPVRTVYFGGGTPSAFEPESLARMVEAIGKNFDLANDCELTLEGRLHDFTPEKTAGFLAAGFNRFSIGVQSFNTAIRKNLGRLSDRDKVIAYLEHLVSFQKAAVIIDLIYGLPGQSPDDFVDDLKLAESLGLDGLDTYQLNIFSGSKLDKALKEGRLPAAAPLQAQGEFYRRASDHLLARRWRQLSLSHYAASGRERNIYNPWAKRRGDCLALGAGAGGFMNGWGFYRRPDVDNYLDQARAGVFRPDALMPPDPRGKLNSRIVSQMEEGHLNHLRLIDDFALDGRPLRRLLENWADNGLIELDEEWMTMTVSGRFWGVNLTQAVIDTAGINFEEN